MFADNEEACATVAKDAAKNGLDVLPFHGFSAVTAKYNITLLAGRLLSNLNPSDLKAVAAYIWKKEVASTDTRKNE